MLRGPHVSGGTCGTKCSGYHMSREGYVRPNVPGSGPHDSEVKLRVKFSEGHMSQKGSVVPNYATETVVLERGDLD